MSTTARPTLLLTGFEPFGGHPVNPSWDIAQRLDGLDVGAWQVRSLCLPCRFGESSAVLRAELHRLNPGAVVALGLAASRHELTIERVAINLDDARIPDNAGLQPLDEPVIPGAPSAYFSTLPVKRLVQRLQAGGHAAAVSHTAGTFVCNHLFFCLMHALRDAPVPAGFVHVPDVGAVPRLSDGDAGEPWTLESMTAAVRLLIETLEPGVRADERLRGGTID